MADSAAVGLEGGAESAEIARSGKRRQSPRAQIFLRGRSVMSVVIGV
jgi:hypothetical protein